MIGQVWQWLQQVPDPEIPVVSVVDLGIIRDVSVTDGCVEVSVAPTYSGCPATEVIEHDIVAELEKHGLENVSVTRVLSPPWTTDWISESGREKLRKYGIAPPAGGSKKGMLRGELTIACPQCSSTDTSRVSEFGSTACKASYRCNACLEPFEYFKCI
jgi:ring-1,2-phenylacetyl-CoA epoxidase subunit PaaD